MKKLIAFLISAVIPVFIPMCAVLTLPVCIAEKYLPQDLQNSVQYGVRFLQLVWNANGDQPEQQQSTVKKELTPVVESAVTSMSIAATLPESDCEFADRTEFAQVVVVEPLMAKISKGMVLDGHHYPMPVAVEHLETEITMAVEKGILQKGALEKLESLPNWKLHQQKLNEAMKIALKKVELQVNQAKHRRKVNPKAIRIAIRNKSYYPA